MSNRRLVSNMNWIITGKMIQMGLGFIISIFSARYLGPGNLGLLDYTISYVSMFSVVAGLGIDSYIMKELIDHKNDQGEVLGSAMLLHLLSSLFSVVGIFCILSITDQSAPMIRTIGVLQGLSILFNTGNTLMYWYQMQLRSKTTSLISALAYALMSAYKILILIQQKDVRFFAFTGSLESLFVSAVLYMTYRRDGGPKLHFSKAMCKDILKHSYHFILADIMAVVYNQTDRIMLKQMLNETMTGYYSLAYRLSNMWPFILNAIIQSMNPLILEAKNQDEELYRRRVKQCYAAVIWISIAVSVLVTLFAPLIIHILYGSAYENSILPLRILTWSVLFAYLGVARAPWIVSEGLQKFEKYLTGIGIFVNIGINALLIPRFGATGAALATLITHAMVNFIVPMMFKELRPNSLIIAEAFRGKDVLKRETLRQMIRDTLKRRTK